MHSLSFLEAHPMIRSLSTALVLCALISFAPAINAQHHSSGGHSHSSSHSSKTKTKTQSSKKSKANGGPVHVNGYYRKDGTYVHSYDRAAPGTATSVGSDHLVQPY